MMYRRQIHGLTLIEIVLYMALYGFMMTGAIQLLILVGRSHERSEIQAWLGEDMLFVRSIIMRTAFDSASVSTDTACHSIDLISTLGVDTVIRFSDTAVFLKEGTDDVPLTSDRISSVSATCTVERITTADRTLISLRGTIEFVASTSGNIPVVEETEFYAPLQQD